MGRQGTVENKGVESGGNERTRVIAVKLLRSLVAAGENLWKGNRCRMEWGGQGDVGRGTWGLLKLGWKMVVMIGQTDFSRMIRKVVKVNEGNLY